MSIYHLSIKIISRSKGKSAVASSAYRAGEKLEDERTGITHDYRNKKGVEYNKIILCENSPPKYMNRNTLWNEVEKTEKQSTAQLAREIEVALPREFSKETQIKVLGNYIKSNFTEKGMIADLAIHDKKDGNPHAHIMLTMRKVKEDGKFAPKSKKVYDLDEVGNRIYQKTDKNGRKQYKNHKEEYTDWNKKEKAEEWRAAWTKECNKYLPKEKSIDHRSYERQGIEKEARIHEGYVARKIERKGEVSKRCEENREINKRNKLLKYVQEELVKTEQKINIISQIKGDELNDRTNKLFRNREINKTMRRTTCRERTTTEGYREEKPEDIRAFLDDIDAKEEVAKEGRAEREENKRRLDLRRKQKIEEGEQRDNKRNNDFEHGI